MAYETEQTDCPVYKGEGNIYFIRSVTRDGKSATEKCKSTCSNCHGTGKITVTVHKNSNR